jgi:5-formyltetrahydrofolate cyclo-ligase
MNKATTRRNIRKRREELSGEKQQTISRNIASRILASQVFSNAEHIAIYLPVSGEADPTTLTKHASATCKHFYLPVIATHENSLLFAPLHSDTCFEPNRFNIPEPVCHPDELLPANQLDLVLMPLVGFDMCGNRLGMGGGFYDRTFAFKKQNRESPPLLIGYAYAFQQIEKLDAESWDVPLDGITTEKNLTLFV